MMEASLVSAATVRGPYRHEATLGEAFRIWLRVAALSFGGPAGWPTHRSPAAIITGGRFVSPGIVSIIALSMIYAACGGVPTSKSPAMSGIRSGSRRKATANDRRAEDLPCDRPIVVCCVYGSRVSGEAAVELRRLGYQARALDGGITAWHAIGGATVPLDRRTFGGAGGRP